MKIHVDTLMSCALHPDTWLPWIPEDILEHIPLDTRVSISCIPGGTWIIADETYHVVWSSEPVEIEKHAEQSVHDQAAQMMKLFRAALQAASEDPNPNPPSVA